MATVSIPQFDGPMALLNTTIATNDGVFQVETISLDRAKRLMSQHINVYGVGVDSAIGHESTAQVMTELLGFDVPVNRQQFQQQPGQLALVFKLKGRPPEGKILSSDEIEAIGYEFKLMTLGEVVAV